MKFIKVTYSVKPDFVSENKKNIRKFIEDLKNINNPGIRYAAHLGEDGKTFIHLSAFESDDDQNILLGLESFKSFQKKRDESGLEVVPVIEEMTLVAASFSVSG